VDGVGDAIVAVLALLGSVLVLLAGVGVLRFPDIYSRMHAATKASTLGLGLIGLAGALAVDGAAARILLAVGAVFVTAPSAAHLVGRSAYRAEGIDLHLDGPDDLGELLHGDGPGDG
jgi:multicomponent Na+:H+ antiporter subunit G